MARTGKTTEPLLGRVFLARQLNQILGGPFFAPWEVDQLPDDEVQAILSINEIGTVGAGLQKVENVFADWRAKHAGKQH